MKNCVDFLLNVLIVLLTDSDDENYNIMQKY